MAHLVKLPSLRVLSLGDNLISDLTPLAEITTLEKLNLGQNQISDIAPLVNNKGLTTGDRVYLINNPLSPISINEYVPALQARGVYVKLQ